ncbi:hypothetical protein K438DRAFT_1961097 [Mycena galopus ATCC 62051]|nr:hypothetical protein K438DRAFT_1961097 [Mycena galopus ATCC 62051]
MRINSDAVPIFILWAQLVDLTLDGGCVLIWSWRCHAGVGSNAGIRISSRVGEPFRGISQAGRLQLRAPHITRLEFHYPQLTPGDLRTAIHHAPCLTHLELTDCQRSVDGALIRAPFYKDGAELLAPQVHNLVLAGLEKPVTEDILVSMMGSRGWSDTELASAVARGTLLRLQGNPITSRHFLWVPWRLCTRRGFRLNAQVPFESESCPKLYCDTVNSLSRRAGAHKEIQNQSRIGREYIERYNTGTTVAIHLYTK